MARKPKVEKPETNEKPQEVLPPEVVQANEAFEEAVIDLIFREPFYANLLSNMRREFTTSLPTAGVNVTEQVNLFVNPYFFCHLTLPQRVALLKHECHHVVNNHFVRFRDLEPKIYESKNKSLWEKIQSMQAASNTNKAADAAINEYLPDLPKKVNLFDKDGKKFTVPKEIKDDKGNMVPNTDPKAGKAVEADLIFVSELKKQFPHIEHNQTMEYYYEFFKQEQEKNKDKNGGSGTDQFVVLDDHDLWHEGDATEDQITDKVKEVVNKAVEQTGDRSMGKMPGELLSAIETLNHVAKDWRQDIQRFAARSSEIKTESTRQKRNRRYGIVYPGFKTFPKLHLTIALDTSGSVCDESLQQFHAEMCRLYNMDIMLTVMECDTKVNATYNFDPKKPFKVHGRGGTQFKPVFEKIEKDKMDTDGLIYFTDGACWGEDIKKPKYPVLWALTPPFQLDGSMTFGSKTKVEIKKRVNR